MGRKIKIYHFSSFAKRLCAYLFIVLVMVFVSISGIFYTNSKEYILSEMVDKTHYKLQVASDQINKRLYHIEATIRAQELIIRQSLNNPDNFALIVEDILKEDSLISSCGIAFAPDYYKSKGYYYMVYASRKGKEIEVRNIGSADYHYPGMDWFLIPSRLKRDYWCEPYFDKGAGNMMMCSFTHPIYAEDGTFIATVTGDVALDKMTNFVKKLEPITPHCSFFITSRHASYLINTDSCRIFSETVFSQAFEEKNKELELIGREMLKGKKGTGTLEYMGKESYAFYTPIPNVNWSMCCIAPSDDILAGLRATTNKVFVLFLIGLSLLSVLTFFIVRWLTKPIHGFAQSAQEIAKGNFDVTLPRVYTKDEIMTLHDSLDNMRNALKDYIEKLRNTTATKERIEKELSIAHNIQMGMLPKIFPDFPIRNDVDLYAIVRPAKEVGGDLYDFLIRDGKLFFTVGDVSGKGVPASLFMAITSSMFRTLLYIKTNPEDVITSMNSSLCENNETNMFVTMIIGVLDLKNGNLKLCNAGHNPPVMVTKGVGAEYVQLKRNIPIGLMPDFKYEADELQLCDDSKFILYTDGITEAENESKALYGEKRLIDFVNDNPEANVRKFISNILNDIDAYAGNAIQSDDITVMDIHFRPAQKTKLPQSQDEK